MVRHFFLNKTATITKGIYDNMGLNPVLSLSYGKTISRALIDVDTDNIVKWINENSLNYNKIKFILHLVNKHNKDIFTKETYSELKDKDISNSFDLEFFSVNKPFDQGRGYDYDEYGKLFGQNTTNTYGVSWYNARTNSEWITPGAYECGVSEIIGLQHFESGTEDINFDITSFIIDRVFTERGLEEFNKHFYGIGIKFTNEYENKKSNKLIEFFSNSTSLFFKPYLEAIYIEDIEDNRNNFNINKDNNLFLYISDGENPVDLDDTPTCSLGNVEHVKKGVYKASIAQGTLKDCSNTIQYDVWSDLVLNNTYLNDEEQEFFVSKPRLDAYNTFSLSDVQRPSIYGLNDSEGILHGDIYTIFVDYRYKYGSEVKKLNFTSEYRIYIKYAGKEYTVFDYSSIDKNAEHSFFIIYADDLIHGEYYVDIKIKKGSEERIFKDILHFFVNDDVDNKQSYYNEYVLDYESVAFLSCKSLHCDKKESVAFVSEKNLRWERNFLSNSELTYNQAYEKSEFLSRYKLNYKPYNDIASFLSNSGITYQKNLDNVELISLNSIISLFSEHIDFLSSNNVRQLTYEDVNFISRDYCLHNSYHSAGFESNNSLYFGNVNSVEFLSNSELKYAKNEGVNCLSKIKLEYGSAKTVDNIELLSSSHINYGFGNLADFLSNAELSFNKNTEVDFLSNDTLSVVDFENTQFLSLSNISHNETNSVSFESNSKLVYNNLSDYAEFNSNESLEYTQKQSVLGIRWITTEAQYPHERASLISSRKQIYENSNKEDVGFISNNSCNADFREQVNLQSNSNATYSPKHKILGIKWITKTG